MNPQDGVPAKRIPRGNPAKYAGIAQEYRQAIDSGDLPEGARLPDHRTLAKKHEVNPVTMHKALTVLQDELYLRSDGTGTYVYLSGPRRKYALLKNLLNDIERDGQDPQLILTGGCAILGRDGGVRWDDGNEEWKMADTA